MECGEAASRLTRRRCWRAAGVGDDRHRTQAPAGPGRPRQTGAARPHPHYPRSPHADTLLQAAVGLRPPHTPKPQYSRLHSFDAVRFRQVFGKMFKTADTASA